MVYSQFLILTASSTNATAHQWCDFEPGHHSDFPPPLRTQSRARLSMWRNRHTISRARLCVRSGGGKSLWCPGL